MELQSDKNSLTNLLNDTKDDYEDTNLTHKSPQKHHNSDENVYHQRTKSLKYNPYDLIFNWNDSNPFLGVKVDFGYILMNDPVGKKVVERNWGFYWMYICTAKPDAPVQITTSGGPGTSCLSKAFGRYNPQDIDNINHRLVKNNKAITDRYHLIYIESPVGAGFSYATKNTKIEKYQHVGTNAVQLVKAIIDKNPSLNLQSCDFFFNGESYCGLQLPVIIKALRDQLKIKFCGVILESPLFHYKQIKSYNYQINMLDDNHLWNSKFHRCSSLLCMCTASWLVTCGCIKLRTYLKSQFIPWNCGFKWAYNKITNDNYKKGSKIEKKYQKYNRFNQSQVDICEDELNCRTDIKYFITSEKFQRYIGAKNWINSISNKDEMNIMDKKDKHFDSNSIMNELLDTGASILILTGEGDYLLPFDGINNNMEKHWIFEDKSKFVTSNWERKENWQSRSVNNLEWRRILGAGHLIFVDNPVVHEDIVVGFLDKHNNR